jgi:hypothetical protein
LNVNHFLLNKHYFLLGRDIFGHNWYSGEFAMVSLHYGLGAYKEKPFEIENWQPKAPSK